MRTTAKLLVVVASTSALGVAHAEPEDAAQAATQVAALLGPPRIARTAAPLTALELGGAAAMPRASRRLATAGDAPPAHELAAAVTLADAGADAPRPAPDAPAPRKEPYLEAREVAALVAPHAPDIERCYLDGVGSKRGSYLALTLVVARDGSLLSLRTAIPGMPGKTLRKIAACAQEALAPVQFPSRRNDTTVIVPYYFQKTWAPGAGPQPSCWNAKGC
jgi:hypothetical protein